MDLKNSTIDHYQLLLLIFIYFLLQELTISVNDSERLTIQNILLLKKFLKKHFKTIKTVNNIKKNGYRS